MDSRMRGVLFFSLIAGLSWPGFANPVGRASQISIRAQSNICVSVRVDPRLLPLRQDTGTNRESALSNVLAFELGRLYERQGGSLVLPGAAPGRNPNPRFVGTVVGHERNRSCDPQSDDVFVTIHYRPRADGGAFVASFRIQQHRSVRSGTFSRDLAAELRAGRALGPHPNPLAYAIAMDVRARAPMLFSRLRP